MIVHEKFIIIGDDYLDFTNSLTSYLNIDNSKFLAVGCDMSEDKTNVTMVTVNDDKTVSIKKLSPIEVGLRNPVVIKAENRIFVYGGYLYSSDTQSLYLYTGDFVDDDVV